MKNGDVFACEKLINHHIRFVMFLVNSKFYKHDKEYLFSIGLTALIRAVDTYGLDRGIIFFTYASRCVENKILMFLQRNKKHANNISLDETISSCEDDKKFWIL